MDKDGRTVKFTGKNYRDNKNKTIELQSAEFIRRFKQHDLSRTSGYFPEFFQDKVLRYHVIGKQQDQNGGRFRLLKITRFISFYEGLTTFEILEEVFSELAICKKGRMVYTIPEGQGRVP